MNKIKMNILGALVFIPALAFAQSYTFSTLVKFPNANKKEPVNPNTLIIDSSGNLYGTSVRGGTFGVGTVFKVTPRGAVSVLHSFSNLADGGFPAGPVIRDSDGNLYGETSSGGTFNYGTIYKLTPAGKETALYNFPAELSATGGASLVRDSAGNLYGYDGEGYGAVVNGYGSVFELSPDGNYRTLYKFCSLTGCPDGYSPFNRLTLKSNGLLYGTTEYGGDSNCSADGCGVVFELDTSGNETVLHSFAGGSDGDSPSSDLTQDAAGNLYGVTAFGGTHGWGILYRLNAANSMSILYNFCSLANCADGASPGGDLSVNAGTVYGITQGNGVGPTIYGNIFQVSPKGVETDLYNAAGPAKLGSGLTRDKAGDLYGTTWDGGPAHNGTVYKLTKH